MSDRKGRAIVSSVRAIDVSPDPVARALRGFGPAGVMSALVIVLAGNIWMLMVAHAAFDLTALAIIYLGLEAAVAQLFFA